MMLVILEDEITIIYQERIAEVYNKYRANLANFRDERRIILKGASAPLGETTLEVEIRLKKLKMINVRRRKH